MRFSTISLIALLIAIASADNWAVIIAGSSSFSNYRHQSNVAHQYHVYLDYGVKPENIIVFSYDDAPSSSSNPFPGQLFNLPGDDAIDYYDGLVIDYKGADVNKENLFNALLGVEDGSGKKVLKSTAEDKVFINYYDHGGEYIIALVSERISSDELQEVLKKMYENQMYKELVFYLEACESATMMEGFPDDLNMYVVTSVDTAVSGYACFCPPDDIVHGEHIGACLSEEFGYAYMKDLEENGGADNFNEQFEYIHTSMAKSVPKQWADLSFTNETLAEFFGVNKKVVKPSQLSLKSTSFWDTRDNALLFYANQLARTDITTEYRNEMIAAYTKESEVREQTEEFYYNLVNRVVGSSQYDEMMKPIVNSISNKQCYFKAIEDVDKVLPMSDYGTKYFKILANMCEKLNIRQLPIY